MVAAVIERDAKIKKNSSAPVAEISRNNCMYKQHLQEDTETVQNSMALYRH